MNDSIAKDSQGFWLKRALEKAQSILAEGFVPLPDNQYQHRFLVEEVNERIMMQQRHDSGFIVTNQLSKISEGLICDLINQGLICGEGANAVKTNMYDDYINHVDLLVHLPNSEVEYIAIDATYSSCLEAKFKRVQREIESGQLSTIDYTGDGLGKVEKIPKLILGLNLNNLCHLSQIWLDQPEELASSNTISSLHLQITKQLAGYQKYAQHHGKTSIAQIFEKLFEYFNRIDDQLETHRNGIAKDKVADTIITHAILIGFTATPQE